jgi:hypothetical protein
MSNVLDVDKEVLQSQKRYDPFEVDATEFHFVVPTTGLERERERIQLIHLSFGYLVRHGGAI